MATFETKLFYYISEYKISTGMRAMRKNLNIHASVADLLYIRIGNLGHCRTLQKQSERNRVFVVDR